MLSITISNRLSAVSIAYFDWTILWSPLLEWFLSGICGIFHSVQFSMICINQIILLTSLLCFHYINSIFLHCMVTWHSKCKMLVGYGQEKYRQNFSLSCTSQYCQIEISNTNSRQAVAYGYAKQYLTDRGNN